MPYSLYRARQAVQGFIILRLQNGFAKYCEVGDEAKGLLPAAKSPATATKSRQALRILSPCIPLLLDEYGHASLRLRKRSMDVAVADMICDLHYGRVTIVTRGHETVRRAGLNLLPIECQSSVAVSIGRLGS
jgi:hypothetical protein